MRLVVGLGNPGEEYEGTRHNVGFEVVDLLASHHRARFKRNWKSRSRVAEVRLAGERVLLAKPQAYMNRSGLAIARLLRIYNLEPPDLLVVVDDADLEPGRLRLRGKGSAGNHNGLKSICAALGADTFARLRIGIGAKPAGADMADFVLSRFEPEERKPVEEAVHRSAKAIECVAEQGLEKAMNEFNTKK